MFRRTTCLLVCATLPIAAASAGEVSRAEFEEVRLGVIDVLSAGASAFPRGRLDFTYRLERSFDGEGGQPPAIDRAVGRVVWEGENARWEYRERGAVEASQLPAGENGDDLTGVPESVVVLTADQMIDAHPSELRAVVRFAPPSRRPKDELAVRPVDCWSHQFNGVWGNGWPTELRSYEPSPADDAAFSVDWEGDRVTWSADVVRREIPLRVTMTAELGEVARVTDYRVEMANGRKTTAQQSEWVQNDRGELYMKSLRVEIVREPPHKFPDALPDEDRRAELFVRRPAGRRVYAGVGRPAERHADRLLGPLPKDCAGRMGRRQPAAKTRRIRRNGRPSPRRPVRRG